MCLKIGFTYGKRLLSKVLSSDKFGLNSGTSILKCSFSTHHFDIIKSKEAIKQFIFEHTVVTNQHLTPEIKLHLITQECKLWSSNGKDCPVPDPFWAFYWPGGQALTRFLLDNQQTVQGKVVLDVGAGCAASSIAACLGGAKRVIANDICPVAVEAAKMNASLNGCEFEITADNLIGQVKEEWDLVLFGDMFYDESFTSHIMDWTDDLRKYGKNILIGDPGRIYLRQNPMIQNLECIFSLDLMEHTMEENSGITEGFVWAFSDL